MSKYLVKDIVIFYFLHIAQPSTNRVMIPPALRIKLSTTLLIVTSLVQDILTPFNSVVSPKLHLRACSFDSNRAEVKYSSGERHFVMFDRSTTLVQA